MRAGYNSRASPEAEYSMEPALKQRVVGAAVLVALAVIFLPMLVKGPAPESGIADVPLELPPAPQGRFETRELPLVTPGAAPTGGVVGLDSAEGSDNEDAADLASPQGQGSDGMFPAATVGGDYAVSFGRYASAADADRVIAALRGSQLPGYQEAITEGTRSLYRVRIGPFATQADAEAARLRAGHVRDDVGAKVVVLNADAATPASDAPASPAPAQAATTVDKPAQKPAKPVENTSGAKPSAPTPSKPPVTRPATSVAAVDTGFAVQIGAFSNQAEAMKLRDRARSAGLRAFVESVRTDQGTLHRVRVGPVLTRPEADQLKTHAMAELGIADAIVKPHP